jgi:hypothetical protein
MVKMIAFCFICVVGWACYQLYPAVIYVTTADEQIDFYSGEKTLYFWVSNEHRELFQIGKTYQLEANQQHKQLVLSTVTFAEIKPDSLKLGFRLLKSDKFAVEANQYQITEVQLVTQP